MPKGPKRARRSPDPVRTAKSVIEQATGQSPRRGPPPMPVEELREIARDVGLEVEFVPPPPKG